MKVYVILATAYGKETIWAICSTKERVEHLAKHSIYNTRIIERG